VSRARKPVPETRVPVRWGRNWRLRIREARGIVARALKLDVDRNVKRRDQARVRAARIVETVAQHAPTEGHEGRWRAIQRLRGQIVELEETCLGCAVAADVPCKMTVRLTARAARALFDITMRKSDEEFDRLPEQPEGAPLQWIHISEDDIICEALIRELKRLGPRRRRRRARGRK
jgi:hypothetical protein